MIRTTLCILGAAILLFPATATAESADEILEKVDDVATKAKDIKATVKMITVDSDGDKARREMTVWQKGQERRMVKLSAPARLEGVGMLATGHDQHYLYLPSFRRVRRVAGERRGRPFLGSNFTQDDMVRTGYASRFEPKLVGSTDDTWTLRLDPKKPDEEPYHHLKLVVRKSDHVVEEILFYEEATEPSRKLVASDVKNVGSATLAHKIVVENLEDGSTSTATLTDVKVDTGLDDSLFSKRYLTR